MYRVGAHPIIDMPGRKVLETVKVEIVYFNIQGFLSLKRDRLGSRLALALREVTVKPASSWIRVTLTPFSGLNVVG